MARWGSVKDALVLTVNNWRLWLLHFAGNAAILVAFAAWTRTPDAHWWQLFLQFFLVIAIAVVMALEQLGLATAVVLTAFAITFGAVMLGLAIAFGLGGQDIARKFLERKLAQHNREEREDELSPL